MQPCFQASDTDDMVQMVGRDDVSDIKVSRFLFQQDLVIGVNPWALALEAFCPVGKLLRPFLNGVTNCDDFQLVGLSLLDLFVASHVCTSDATATDDCQPHRSLTVTHILIPLAGSVASALYDN
jgi:hypothetical protein